jgi:hypothetical protein
MTDFQSLSVDLILLTPTCSRYCVYTSRCRFVSVGSRPPKSPILGDFETENLLHCTIRLYPSKSPRMGDLGGKPQAVRT